MQSSPLQRLLKQVFDDHTNRTASRKRTSAAGRHRDTDYWLKWSRDPGLYAIAAINIYRSESEFNSQVRPLASLVYGPAKGSYCQVHQSPTEHWQIRLHLEPFAIDDTVFGVLATTEALTYRAADLLAKSDIHGLWRCQGNPSHVGVISHRRLSLVV